MMLMEWLFSLPNLGICLGISLLSSLMTYQPPTHNDRNNYLWKSGGNARDFWSCQDGV